MYGALPYVVYTGMCRPWCVFLAIFVFNFQGCCCFGPGFDRTYTSDIIIGI